MKRLMIYSKRKLPFVSGGKDIIKQNGVLIMLFTVFVCGLITGISLYFGADRERELISLFTERLISKDPLPYFASELLLNFIILAIIMISGVGAAGFPFIAAMPFVKGLLNGILSAFLIGSFSTKGFGYYALMIVPGGALCVSAMLFLCEYCFSVSVKVFKCTFTENREGVNGARLLAVYGIALAAAILSCAVSLLFRLIFGGIFKLF